MFTSPHLISPVERIKINGKSISKEDFSRLFFYVWDKLHTYSELSDDIPTIPTYFRYLFLMAIQKFFEKKVDVAVIEVGFGGELDSTNVIREPAVCAVTLIGYDHEHVLGSTLGEIAWQKAGIFKKGSLALTIVQHPEASKIIEKRAAEANVRSYAVVREDRITRNQKLGIEGDHQYQNAALAAEISSQWSDYFNEKNTEYTVKVTSDIISRGLESAKWQGRTHILKSAAYKNITWYVDGAHNIESMQVIHMHDTF